MPAPEVADYCAAHWPDFAPPLTREAVDQIAEAGIAAGGKETRERQDYGFMYSRAIADPDGHTWEYMWMDMSQMPTE